MRPPIILTRAAVGIRPPRALVSIPGALAPGELPVRGVLAGLSAPVASGVLPTSAWAAADAAVAASWKLVAQMEEQIKPGSPQRDGVLTMKALAQRQSETLERLKHDPRYPENMSPQAAIDAWRRWYNPGDPESFAAWARSLKADDAQFNSVWGMLKDVTYQTALDVGTGVRATGDALLGAGSRALKVIAYLPYLAVGAAVLLGGFYVWRLTRREKAPTPATPLSPPSPPPATVSGLSRRRRRRRR